MSETPYRPLPPHHGPSWHKEPPQDSPQAALLALIRKHPGINTDELALRLKTPSHRLRPDLNRLHTNRGLIGRQAGLGDHAIWSTWYPETVSQEVA